MAVTIYRKVGVGENADGASYITYDTKPVSYWRKAQVIKWLFGKKVISGELQAEPWFPKNNYEVSFQEQQKTMHLGQFKENIEYAKDTGFDTFYLWGAEWMYLLKEQHGKPEIWNAAKELFRYGTIQ